MPEIQIPLVKGQGKSFKNADYVDLLPTNIVPIVSEAEGAAGYFRFWPGVTKLADVNGVSRGSHWNTVKDAAYRVMGGKLYLGQSEVADVPGAGRVAMAHSRTSQAVSVDGNLRLYRYDGTEKILDNWPPAVDVQPYQFQPVGDVCRLRGRYVFNKAGTDSFFLTDIEDESKLDRIAAKYRAENMPDGILAVREFRDFILCFGSSTIEYFRLTGDANNLVSFASSYMVSIGIAGQFALTEFMDTFAFITSPARGQVIVALMGQGDYKQISDRHINKLLAGYSKEELAGVFVESLKTEDNQFLILHLPRETVTFNATSGMWSIIKTGLANGTHRAVDYRNEGDTVTCGDKLAGFLGKQDQTTSAQYGDDQEIILYSPLINMERGLMFDMQLTANSGLASEVRRIFVSSTADGINYGPEKPIEFDGSWQWLRRAIIRKVGQIVIRLGFKLRIVGATPCTLSNLKARIE